MLHSTLLGKVSFSVTLTMSLSYSLKFFSISVAVLLWDSIFCFKLLIGLLLTITVSLGNLMGK